MSLSRASTLGSERTSSGLFSSLAGAPAAGWCIASSGPKCLCRAPGLLSPSQNIRPDHKLRSTVACGLTVIDRPAYDERRRQTGLEARLLGEAGLLSRAAKQPEPADVS